MTKQRLCFVKLIIKKCFSISFLRCNICNIYIFFLIKSRDDDIFLLGEDCAGLVVELLDDRGQGVLVHVGDVRHIANLKYNHILYICVFLDCRNFYTLPQSFFFKSHLYQGVNKE